MSRYKVYINDLSVSGGEWAARYSLVQDGLAVATGKSSASSPEELAKRVSSHAHELVWGLGAKGRLQERVDELFNEEEL